jgi:hypothetical protein
MANDYIASETPVSGELKLEPDSAGENAQSKGTALLKRTQCSET